MFKFLSRLQIYNYFSYKLLCPSFNQNLSAFLYVDSLLRIGNSAALEVEEGLARTFIHLCYSCRIIGFKSDNCAETAPRRSSSICFYRTCGNMKRGRGYGRVVKHPVVCCLGDAVRIAIDICQVAAILECIVTDECHTFRNADGGQVATTIKSAPVNSLYPFGNDNRCQTAAQSESFVHKQFERCLEC